jgi:[ribosomal protein S18]-alanine N-acetyltransferase
MKVRLVEAPEMLTLATLAQRADAYPWSEQVLLDCLKAHYSIWVMESSQKIIQGFVVVLCQLDECELLNICVDPSCQRQGIGRYLLGHAVRFSQQKGMKLIRLEVRADNSAAQSLYHSLGFIKVGVRKGYYPCDQGRDDAHLFVLRH